MERTESQKLSFYFYIHAHDMYMPAQTHHIYMRAHMIIKRNKNSNLKHTHCTVVTELHHVSPHSRTVTKTDGQKTDLKTSVFPQHSHMFVKGLAVPPTDTASGDAHL